MLNKWPPPSDILYPTWGLVIVGAAAALAAIRTLRTIKRQADLMQDQLRQMQDASAQTERQIRQAVMQTQENRRTTEHARANADAAKLNAGAAMLNAQAIIHAERPWVTIFVERVKGTGYLFKMVNLGRSPAEIISFAIGFKCVSNIRELPAEPEYGKEQVPQIRLLVPSDGEPGGHEIEMLDNEGFWKYLEPCIMSRDRTEHALRTGPKLPVICLRILYQNPLSKIDPSIPGHETRMCFGYFHAIGTLEVCGGDRYNSHT